MPFLRLRRSVGRITWQVPLAMMILLVAVGSILTAAAYREVRRGAREAAMLRVRNAAASLAGAMGRTLPERIDEQRAVAGAPAVRALLETPRSGNADRAASRLHALIDQGPAVDAVEVWDTAGRLVMVLRGDSATLPDRLRGPPDPPAPGDSVAVSPIRISGDNLWIDLVTPIPGREGRAGYLVQRRRVRSNSQAVALLNDLIGNAEMLLGDPVHGWTDLLAGRRGPTLADLDTTGAGRYADEEVTRLGAVAAILGTPWRVWVGLPEDVVYRRATEFLRNLGLFAAVVVAIGGLVGWLVSRRFTVPLRDLTAAAAALAQGRLEHEVPVRHDDELGRLAQTFNQMAQAIVESQHGLETAVTRRTSELRAALERLEEANRELEAFSYSVSHDLRAPLRAINGFSQALVEDCPGELGPRAREYLTRVSDGAARMGHLIDDLLALSRVSRTPLRRVPVRLDELAEDVVRDLRMADPDRNVEIVIQPGLVVRGDPRLLRTAVQNLIDNAWKFTRPRNEARITFTQLNGPDSAFCVRDNGVGFDMAYAHNLFGVFQRLHAQTEFPGTGVGLAIVQRVIHRHGGRVWADAEPDGGATIWFTVPSGVPVHKRRHHGQYHSVGGGQSG